MFLIQLKREPTKYMIDLTFKATKNKPNYGTLIIGVRFVKGMGVTFVKAKCDSQMVVNLVKGNICNKWHKDEEVFGH